MEKKFEMVVINIVKPIARSPSLFPQFFLIYLLKKRKKKKKNLLISF